jgi:hypothetical protein
MASSQTQKSLIRQLRAGTVAAIVCLASVWLANALAFAPLIGA